MTNALNQDTVLAAAIAYKPSATGEAMQLPEHLAETVSLTYFDLSGIDNRTNLAVHFKPHAALQHAPVILSIHGSGLSVYKEPGWPLSCSLASRGIPVLAVNTRQHDEAVNTDVFSATIRDIDAAFWMARSLGYRRIILMGHSLGSAQISFFAANFWDADIGGVILIGMPAQLPWKSRHVLIANENLYNQMVSEANDAVREGDFDRVLSTPMPWLGGKATRVTAGHFASYRDENLAVPRSVDWIARVPYPVLLARDENDPIIRDFEMNEMLAAAQAGRPRSVDAVTLRSTPGTDGHSFADTMSDLTDTIVSWIDKVATRGPL